MQLAAVGGEKQIAAAIRLAGYKYDEIESVKTVGNASFNVGAAGDLPEQSGSITERAFLLKSMYGEAVLNLFADAHWATGENVISEGIMSHMKRVMNTAHSPLVKSLISLPSKTNWMFLL